MNSALGIECTDYAFGSNIIDNIEWGQQHGFDKNFIENKLGIRTRYVAENNQKTSDLAIEAAKRVLNKSQKTIKDIQFICVVTQTPDYKLPHTAALVQRALNLSHNIPSFDLNLGCSGYIYGLSVATAFMSQNNLEVGLLITADTYNKYIDKSDRATSALFSDAAAATLISNDAKYLIGKGCYYTDGSGAENLIIGHSENTADAENLYMDGRAIYNFMMNAVPPSIDSCLKLNQLDFSNVDKFIFHQANHFMLESLRNRLGIDKAKMVYYLEGCGNTVSSSIPIALGSILPSKVKHILVSGFGVGLSWATNILIAKNQSYENVT